ncbi:MAG: TPM domain-containing protein [Oscillospiraceae bacterium]|jgi:uncharacterized membrane protein YgcG|nr:TPM domain-containing protein [Oscillospiraceae bacterium]
MLGRKTRFFVIAMLAAVMTVCFCVPAFAAEPSALVRDDAGVLSADTAENLLDLNSGESGLATRTDGAFIAVRTIEYLNGLTPEEAAESWYSRLVQEGFSDKCGFLLLVVTKEKTGAIATGSEIAPAWDKEARRETLGASFFPSVAEGDFNTAVNMTAAAALEWFRQYYRIPSSEANAPAVPDEDEGLDFSFDFSNTWFAEYGGLDGIFDYDWLGSWAVPKIKTAAISVAAVLATVLAFVVIALIAAVIIIRAITAADRRKYRAYSRVFGAVLPSYHFWFAFSQSRPYQLWYKHLRTDERARRGL